MASTEQETTYKIVRYYSDPNMVAEVKQTGLTLAEAQAHCNDPATQSPDGGETWFEGYTREGNF